MNGITGANDCLFECFSCNVRLSVFVCVGLDSMFRSSFVFLIYVQIFIRNTFKPIHSKCKENMIVPLGISDTLQCVNASAFYRRLFVCTVHYGRRVYIGCREVMLRCVLWGRIQFGRGQWIKLTFNFQKFQFISQEVRELGSRVRLCRFNSYLTARLSMCIIFDRTSYLLAWIIRVPHHVPTQALPTFVLFMALKCFYLFEFRQKDRQNI